MNFNKLDDPPPISQGSPEPLRRSRVPRGPVSVAYNSGSSSSCAPALLELAGVCPMHTVQRHAPHYFIPDAQMLFHVLGICDSMMNTTDCFLKSSPAWLPIVSQLYISVLWNFMIIRVFNTSGYGAAFIPILNDYVRNLRIDECMIPGPLVPFFQALAAVKVDRIGCILPALPNFSLFWSGEHFCATDNYVRQIPVPAIILDQLYYFATCNHAEVQNNRYATFLWYKNIFNRTQSFGNIRQRLGPQLCGSLYTCCSQFDAAFSFWSSAFHCGFTRIDAAPDQPPLVNYAQLFGFQGQDGSVQIDWFQQISIVMQKYAQYFNESVPLKSVALTGLGACAVYGTLANNVSTRNWIYPKADSLAPFATSRFAPLREIPSIFSVTFRHANYELEQLAEKYAVVSHTNLVLSDDFVAQYDLPQIVCDATHTGDYWRMATFRFSTPVQLKIQYAHVIISRYHQQTANRFD